MIEARVICNLVYYDGTNEIFELPNGLTLVELSSGKNNNKE